MRRSLARSLALPLNSPSPRRFWSPQNTGIGFGDLWEANEVISEVGNREDLEQGRTSLPS
jgi:hypothetical protein